MHTGRMHPALLYRSGSVLSDAELHAMRLDGLVFEVGDAYLPADVPETANIRLLSLASHVRDEHVVSGTTAAWVHGAGDKRPTRCHVRPHVARRLRAPAETEVVLHDGVVPPHEFQVLSGLRVLTVPATLVDLARAERDAEARMWLVALVAQDPTQVSPAIDLLRARERLPGKRRAIATLESGYEEVTRYTS